MRVEAVLSHFVDPNKGWLVWTAVVTMDGNRSLASGALQVEHDELAEGLALVRARELCRNRVTRRSLSAVEVVWREEGTLNEEWIEKKNKALRSTWRGLPMRSTTTKRSSRSTRKIKRGPTTLDRERKLKYLLTQNGPGCCWCGFPTVEGSDREAGDDQRTIEHLQALSRGGSNNISNLRIACYGCNRRRGNTDGPPPVWRTPADADAGLLPLTPTPHANGAS